MASPPLRGARRVLLLVAMLASPWGVSRAGAQDVTLPASIQAELIGKILTFDRALSRYGATITLGVLHQADNRSSAAAMRDLSRAFEAGGAMLPQGVELRIVPIALDGSLPPGLSARVDVLVFTPMRAIDPRRIASEAEAQGLLTIGAHPSYNRSGPAISLLLEDSRPHIVVDLRRSRRVGADFESRLLRLCEVVE